jgi:uncharacterized MnhB-related membrane protein
MTHPLLPWLQLFVLLMVAASALGVVKTREPAEQAIALSFYGLIVALMFVLFQAPDVALSQLVVGAVALPLVVVLALGQIRHEEHRRRGSKS